MTMATSVSDTGESSPDIPALFIRMEDADVIKVTHEYYAVLPIKVKFHYLISTHSLIHLLFPYCTYATTEVLR